MKRSCCLKGLLVAGSLCALLLALILWLIFAGPVLDRYEVDVGDWSIKILHRRDLGLHEGFTMFSKPPGAWRWKKVFSDGGDDPFEVPRDHLGIISGSAAYFYLYDRYLVTTDSGHTWHEWSGLRDLKPACPHWVSIESVNIRESGLSEMMVCCNTSDGTEARLFTSSNLGVSWEFDQLDDPEWCR